MATRRNNQPKLAALTSNSLSMQDRMQITIASADTSKAGSLAPESFDESSEQQLHGIILADRSGDPNGDGVIGADMNRQHVDEQDGGKIVYVNDYKQSQQQKEDHTDQDELESAGANENKHQISENENNMKEDENEAGNEQKVNYNKQQHEQQNHISQMNNKNTQSENEDEDDEDDDTDDPDENLTSEDMDNDDNTVIDQDMDATMGKIQTTKDKKNKSEENDSKSDGKQLKEAGAPGSHGGTDNDNRDAENGSDAKTKDTKNASQNDSVNNNESGGSGVSNIPISPDEDDAGGFVQADPEPILIPQSESELPSYPRVKVRGIGEVKLFLEHFTVPLGTREMFYAYFWRPIFLCVNIRFIINNYVSLYEDSNDDDERRYHLKILSQIIAHTEFYVLMMMILVMIGYIVRYKFDKSMDHSPIIVDIIREMGRWSGFKLSYILRPEGIRAYLMDIYANSSIPYHEGRKKTFATIAGALKEIKNHIDNSNNDNNDNNNNDNSNNKKNSKKTDDPNSNDPDQSDVKTLELKVAVDNGNAGDDHKNNERNEKNNDNNDNSSDGPGKYVDCIAAFDCDIGNIGLIHKVDRDRKWADEKSSEIGKPSVHQEFFQDLSYLVLGFFTFIGVGIGFCAVILKLSQFVFITDTAIENWGPDDTFKVVAFCNQLWGIVNMENVRRSSLFEYLYIDMGSPNQTPSITRNSRFHIMALDCVIKQGLTEQGWRGWFLAISLPYSLVLKILLKNPFEDDLIKQIERKEDFRAKKQREYKDREDEKKEKKKNARTRSKEAINASVLLKRQLSPDTLGGNDLSSFSKLQKHIEDTIAGVIGRKEMIKLKRQFRNGNTELPKPKPAPGVCGQIKDSIGDGWDDIVNLLEKKLSKWSLQLSHEDFKDDDKDEEDYKHPEDKNTCFGIFANLKKCFINFKNHVQNCFDENFREYFEKYFKKKKKEPYSIRRVERGTDFSGNVKLWQAEWLRSFRPNMSSAGFLRVHRHASLDIDLYEYKFDTKLDQYTEKNGCCCSCICNCKCTCGGGNENIKKLPTNASGHASILIDQFQQCLNCLSRPLTITILLAVVLWEIIALSVDGWLDVNGIADECVVTGKDQADGLKNGIWMVVIYHFFLLAGYIFVLLSWIWSGCSDNEWSITEAILSTNIYLRCLVGFVYGFGFVYGWMAGFIVSAGNNSVCVSFDFASKHYPVYHSCIFASFVYGWVLFAAGVLLIISQKGAFWLISRVIAFPFVMIYSVILTSVWNGAGYTVGMLIYFLVIGFGMDGCFVEVALVYCIASVILHVLFVICTYCVDYKLKSFRNIPVLGWDWNRNDETMTKPSLTLSCCGELKRYDDRDDDSDDDSYDDSNESSDDETEKEKQNMLSRLQWTATYYKFGTLFLCVLQLSFIIFWHIIFHFDFGWSEQCTSEQTSFYAYAGILTYVLLVGWGLSWISVQCMWYRVVNKKKLNVMGISFTIRQFLVNVAALTLRSTRASSKQSSMYRDPNNYYAIVRIFGTQRIHEILKFGATLKDVDRAAQKMQEEVKKIRIWPWNSNDHDKIEMKNDSKDDQQDDTKEDTEQDKKQVMKKNMKKAMKADMIDFLVQVQKMQKKIEMLDFLCAYTCHKLVIDEGFA